MKFEEKDPNNLHVNVNKSFEYKTKIFLCTISDQIVCVVNLMISPCPDQGITLMPVTFFAVEVNNIAK